jgi:hypothetical protein
MDSLSVVFERIRNACAEEEVQEEPEEPEEEHRQPSLDFAPIVAAACGQVTEELPAALAGVGADVRSALDAAARRLECEGASEAAVAFVEAQLQAKERPWWRPVKEPGPCDAFPDRPAELELCSVQTVRVCGDFFLRAVAAAYLASFRLAGTDVYCSGMSAAEVHTNYGLAKQCLLI